MLHKEVKFDPTDAWLRDVASSPRDLSKERYYGGKLVTAITFVRHDQHYVVYDIETED